MLYRTSLNAPVFGLRREIDRLFEDTFGRDNMSAWTPAVDIRETQNELRLDLELPGINPDDVEITTDNGVLTVRGEKHSERKEGEDESRYHIVERSYGSFTRSFQLPQGLDDSRIEATCDNGILSIHIPKAALPQPKKIQIKAGSKEQNKVSGTGTQSGQRQMGTGRTEPAQEQMPRAASGTRNTGSKERTQNGGEAKNTGARS
jgi:HSP20 family protein